MSETAFGTGNNGNQVLGVAWGNGKFVAVGKSVKNIAAYSSDGINWTGCFPNSNANNSFSWVVYKNSTWVVSGNIGLYSSSDGITWTYKSSFTSGGSIDWNGTYWVSSNNSYSTDLVTWTAGSKSGSFTSFTPDSCVRYNGTNKIIAGGWLRNGLMTSTNGTSWVASTYSNVVSVTCIDYYQYTSTWVLGQYTGGATNGNQVLYSTNDGTTWNIASTNTFFGAGGYPVAIASSINSPLVIGTAPTITSVTTGVSSFNVYFTAGTGGTPAPTTYQYSLNGGSTYTDASSTTSPIVISSGISIGVTYQITLKATNAAGNTVASNMVAATLPVPCFLEGSKIVRMNPETDDEEQVPVESLRRGDLIKTANHGYKAIELIGSRIIPNPLDIPNKSSRLYWFRKKRIPGLREDLCVTGDHCILHKTITEDKRNQVLGHMGDIFVTEDHYRVPAFLDDRAEPYEDSPEPVTIWHFALENPNIYHNYGVYANGLLVESSSLHYMYKHSKMKMV